ncbi:MAG: phosphate ABC transporter, permease protein PstA, partial [Planctomycetota bacterium]
TGAILAMARGAGEVAPLMLVGAVNFSPAPPISAEAPFLHGDRTFMHLGFQIYNLGFQSPDSESTEPLVWTTTLLLVAIVVALNLIAVVIRARLRGRYGSAV